MAIQLPSQDEDDVIAAINTTPLVDVMLVLLIIFLITIPVVTTSVKVQLPLQEVQIRETKPENVIISVNRVGQIFIYDSKVKNVADLQEKLLRLSQLKPQPDVEIRGDAQSEISAVGQVIYSVQRAGIVKVKFVTEPGSQ